MSFNLFKITLFLCIISVNALLGQKTDYRKIYYSFDVKPTMEKFKSYKTFDLTFSNEMESLFKKGEDLKFHPEFGTLQQVDSSEDLHVICTLYNIKLHKVGDQNGFDVDMHTVIANKYGTRIYEKNFIYNNIVYVPNPLNNKYSLKYYCVQQAISYSLYGYTRAVFGYKTENTEFQLAQLDDVKKKSGLDVLEEQVDDLKKQLEKRNSVSGFLMSAKSYLPSWEKMAAYSEKGEVNEVKRAAYQNLAVYYIIAGEIEKAQEIIEEYKKIDKEVKGLMGLVKYKNSEELDKLIDILYPKATLINEQDGGSNVLSKEEVIEKISYKVFEGTVKLKEKKAINSYTGIIKIKNNTKRTQNGSILDLDAKDIEMVVINKNPNGKQDTINTYISKIEEMVDKAGKKYIAKKISDVVSFIGSDAGIIALMSPSYESPKVTVYRCIVPSTLTGDFLMKKAGDENGIRNGLFNNLKKMADYLSDCPDLNAKVKANEIDKKISPEEFAKLYSDCSSK